MDQVNLFRKNSMGVGTWRVWTISIAATSAQIGIAHSVVQGGSEVQHVDNVKTNGSGRSIQQQVDLEMQSRINRQLDKGYKHTVEEALNGSTNQMGLVNPMLAQKLKDVKLGQSHFADAYMQRKYDGHRCLITKQGGEMLAYSRKGKPITSIPHILQELEPLMQDGDTTDGELYKHGVSLQTIGSWIKRDQPESKTLEYMWYDMCISKPFGQRHRLMQDLSASLPRMYVRPVDTVKVSTMGEVFAHFNQARSDGYEGSMLRISGPGYEDGKRSNQLLKVKEREDGEVTVLSGRPSARGWAILNVQCPWEHNGKPVTFDISAPGDVKQKTEVLTNIDKYVGRQLTIEYAMLTDEMVPFHAVAMRWRDDV